MVTTTKTLSEIINGYTKVIEEAQRYNFFVRDTGLQEEQIGILTNLKQEIKFYKKQAISAHEEKQSNLLFHFQCVLNSLISVLGMWVHLKNMNYEAAWDKLIDSQEYILVGLKVLKMLNNPSPGLESYLQNLHKIEETIFPNWSVYISPAFIIDGGECSICRIEYGSCDHLEDLIYLGQLCRRINVSKLDVNHTAFVENPRDKRCVIRYISTDDGHKKDNFTLKVLDEKFSTDKDGSLYLSGKMFCNNELDFN